MLSLLAGSLGEKDPHEPKGIPLRILTGDLDRLIHGMPWKPDKPMMVPVLEDRRDGNHRRSVLG
jgi:hypothetical protein